MVILRSLVTTGAIFLYGLQEAHGQDSAIDGGITCPEIFQTPGLCLSDNNELQGGNKLTCTAGDIVKAEPNEPKIEVQEIITGCTGPDSTATFKADLTYTVFGDYASFDTGLYIASDADADGDVGNCNIFSFGCLNVGRPDDGDLCGDRQGFNREQGLEITAACVANAEGQFKVPYCFSYSQSISAVTCTDAAGSFEGDPQPFQAIPGTPAECQCDGFDLGDQICLVNLNLNANELQPTCTVEGLADIVIFGADIAIVGAVGGTFEYEISPGNGPQDYSAGDDIVIANPSSETTYTILVARTSDPTVACIDTFEITTGPCGPDTCDDTGDFAGCEAGFSLIDPAAKCVDALDVPMDCTNAICCVQVRAGTCDDTADSSDDTADFAGCEAGFSLIDPAAKCVDALDVPTDCTNAICCVQDMCDDTADFAGCEAGFSLIDPAAKCVNALDVPTDCTNAICCVQDTCDDTADFAGCEAGFSLIDPAAECVNALDMPTDCTSAICCVQDTCASYTVECAPGTSSVDDTVLCDGECSAETCCDQVTVTCDTAFGCEEVHGESCSSPTLNEIEGVAANRWGWYIETPFDATEQEFIFDMYAGAGQNVLANGAYAGNVVVTVNSDGSSDYVANPEDGYCFDDVHLHVGNELPTKKKKRVTTVTVAPGQYTQTTVHEGDLYIIVHVGETCTPCGH